MNSCCESISLCFGCNKNPSYSQLYLTIVSLMFFSLNIQRFFFFFSRNNNYSAGTFFFFFFKLSLLFSFSVLNPEPGVGTCVPVIPWSCILSPSFLRWEQTYAWATWGHTLETEGSKRWKVPPLWTYIRLPSPLPFAFLFLPGILFLFFFCLFFFCLPGLKILLCSSV